MAQVTFNYCKTTLPENLTEGGIYFVEPEKKIYKVTDGIAVDYTGLTESEEKVITEALSSLHNRVIVLENLDVMKNSKEGVEIEEYLSSLNERLVTLEESDIMYDSKEGQVIAAALNNLDKRLKVEENGSISISLDIDDLKERMIAQEERKQKQSDWEENSTSNVAYIKNRTHWKETQSGYSYSYKFADEIDIDSNGVTTFYYVTGTPPLTRRTAISSKNDSSTNIISQENLLYSFSDSEGTEYSGTLDFKGTEQVGNYTKYIWANSVFTYSYCNGTAVYNFNEFLNQTINTFRLKAPEIAYHKLDNEYLKPIENVEVEYGHYETTEIAEVGEWVDIDLGTFNE